MKTKTNFTKNLFFKILLITVPFILLGIISSKLLFKVLQNLYGLYFYEALLLTPWFFLEDIFMIFYHPSGVEAALLMPVPVLGTVLFWILFLFLFYLVIKKMEQLKLKKLSATIVLILVSFLAGFSIYSSFKMGDLMGFAVALYLIVICILVKLTYTIYTTK